MTGRAAVEFDTIMVGTSNRLLGPSIDCAGSADLSSGGDDVRPVVRLAGTQASLVESSGTIVECVVVSRWLPEVEWLQFSLL